MSHAIVITGMHRSGTSLTSSLLQHAGVNIGDKLLPATSANPRGFFEDVDFYEYHENLLQQRGQSYLRIDNNFTFHPSDSETERARELIAERSHRSFWGWKDPRTSLFLDFWHRLLPDGRFLFVYRHPIEVLLSLLRRGDLDTDPSLMAGLQAWYAYNSNILKFFDRHSERCLLAHIDGIVKNSARFFQLLQDKLRLDVCLDSDAVAQIYHAKELQTTSLSPQLTTVLVRIYPELLALYQQLNEKSDLRHEENQNGSATPAHLSQLAQFAECLSEPISAPVKYSLVQLLLSSLIPESTERMFDRLGSFAKESQQKIEYLWREVQWRDRIQAEQNLELDREQRHNAEQSLERDRLQRLNAEQDSELVRLQRLVAEQSQTLENLQWLNIEQNQALEQQSARIEALEAELNNIHGTRVWKAVESYRKFKKRWENAA